MYTARKKKHGMHWGCAAERYSLGSERTANCESLHRPIPHTLQPSYSDSAFGGKINIHQLYRHHVSTHCIGLDSRECWQAASRAGHPMCPQAGIPMFAQAHSNSSSLMKLQLRHTACKPQLLMSFARCQRPWWFAAARSYTAQGVLNRYPSQLQHRCVFPSWPR